MQQMQVDVRVQEFIAHNRARRIQEVYVDHLFDRRRAARCIQSRWRKYKKMMAIRELRQAQQNRVRKRVAINRIYDLHRNIKVKKVNASAMLLHGALIQNLAQMTQSNPELETQVIRI